MRLRPTTLAPPAETPQQLDPLLHCRILVETAMEQAQCAGADAALISRQLAGELRKCNAALSDVRVVVLELYQGDRPSAEAYLAYLAQSGFPTPTQNAPDTQPQLSPIRTLEQQNRAIAHPHAGAYGQTAEPPADAAPLDGAFYGGNLIAELVANSAYSALVLGERRSGTSAILRALLYDRISRSGDTILDILDLHNGEWGGLENIKLTDGSQIVTYHALSAQADIAVVAAKLAAVAAEVRRRQQQQRSQSLSLSAKPPPPYLFLIDGLSELHGALPGWSADRRSKDAAFNQAATSLRVILSHGPAVGLSCVATARDHSTCLCDATALGETRLLCLGRISAGRNGGYRAIERAVEDKDLLPSPHERSRYRSALAAIKRRGLPVVFTPNGIPRLGSLGDFGGYLSLDLLTHYQQALEALP